MSLLCYFLAALLIAVITEWGPKCFSAIVSDNAANMVKARRLVLEKFPHMTRKQASTHCNFCLAVYLFAVRNAKATDIFNAAGVLCMHSQLVWAQHLAIPG